jgi:hypothetical protein
MVFWSAQVGPHYDGDTRDDAHRCIAEVICPDCDNVLARLHERPKGFGLRAWIPAPSMYDPDSRRVGWSLYARVDETTPADDEGSTLNCWRGHYGLWIDASDCRAIIRRYRTRGRKVRHPARRVP